MKKKRKYKKIKEVGAAVMTGPSGPQYDTTGNNSLNEQDELLRIIKLIKYKNKRSS